ncbi:bZIP transcription factor domain-containing protein [Ditylenchus destructor]|uniref:BZIP transcription factor domain-containing protein n=1 Tax=Ditylenchus destructor TaxID=166010 RepID=A0AAD4R655_9BILA|nr:bZIP transcription factor domain-containing protein [Ditylenchus destructor]
MSSKLVTSYLYSKRSFQHGGDLEVLLGDMNSIGYELNGIFHNKAQNYDVKLCCDEEMTSDGKVSSNGQNGDFVDLMEQAADADVLGDVFDPDQLIRELEIDGEFTNFTDEMYSNCILDGSTADNAPSIGFEYQPFSAHSSDSGFSPNSASSSNESLTPLSSLQPTDSIEFNEPYYCSATTAEQSLTSDNAAVNCFTFNECFETTSNSTYEEQKLARALSMPMPADQQNSKMPPWPVNKRPNSHSIAKNGCHIQPAQQVQNTLPLLYVVQDSCQPHPQLVTNMPLRMVSTNSTNSVRMQPYPASRSVSVKTPPEVMTVPLSCSATTPSKFPLPSRPKPSNSAMPREEDDFLKKKEDRKLRNREAAQLSRQRKRHEYEDLKARLDASEKMCEQLKSENKHLRKRVEELEKENKTTRVCTNLSETRTTKTDKNQEPGSQYLLRKSTAIKRAGICMLVIMAFVALPGSNYFEGGQVAKVTHTHLPESYKKLSLPKKEANLTKTMGRALIDDMDAGGYVENMFNRNETNMNSSALATNTSIKCPDNIGSITSLNTSQRIQLNADLSNWIDRHEQMNLVRLRSDNNRPTLIFNSRTSHIPKVPFVSEPSQISTPPKEVGYFSADSPVENGIDSRINGTRRRSTAAKKEAARLKAIRDRAWRHLDMISLGKPSVDSDEKSNDSTLTTAPSLVALGPIGRRQQRVEQLRSRSNGLDDNGMAEASNNSGLLPSKTHKAHMQMSQLISTVHQKDDMLYVIAIKDYFLLPALERPNTTVPPKITLVLPALSITDSTNTTAGSQKMMTMMRIECEVVASGMFFLPESVVSLFNLSNQPEPEK